MVTRDEVLSLGVSRGQASRLVQRRILVPMWRGVYATGGVPLTPIVRLAGAVVATNGAASHVSAAWLHGLLDAPEDPEVTVNRTADGRRVGVLLHRCDDLSPQDTVVRNGIRVTDATRTCIDLGAVLSPRELERVIERARARRLINLDRLVTRFLSLSRPGRVGLSVVRSVLEDLDPALRPVESDLEAMVVQIIRRHDLPEPARQVEVKVGGRRFRLDLCYPDRRVAIECDGFSFHGSRSAFESDRERQNLLVLSGWRVLRFTWRQVVGRPTWVAQQIATALDSARPR